MYTERGRVSESDECTDERGRRDAGETTDGDVTVRRSSSREGADEGINLRADEVTYEGTTRRYGAVPGETRVVRRSHQGGDAGRTGQRGDP